MQNGRDEISVTVIDEKKRLRGIIKRESVIQALGKH